MEKITWYMNDYGDVEVWKGDWLIQEVVGYVADLYVHNKDVKHFFLLISVNFYEIECGDWNTAEAYWDGLEGAISA